jgi:hypothetical protein
MSSNMTIEEYRATVSAPAARKPRKAKAKEIVPREHDEQARLVAWAAQREAELPELALLLAIPNGAKLPFGRNSKGQRFSREAVKLKREGLRPGTPDMLLAYPKNGLAGLWIEMKRRVKSLSSVSEEQKAMIEKLRAVGYRAEICYGWEAARDVLLNYLEAA